MAAASAQLKARTVRSPLLLVMPALAAYLLPGAGAVMIYDRAAILDGEIWRLLTGHWVHFSASHLLCDAAVLAVIAFLCELRGYRHLPALCLLAAPAIGLAMLLLLPDLAEYGGLSGIAMAGIVYFALHALRDAEPWRELGLGILLLAGAKLVFDFCLGQFLLVDTGTSSVLPVPLSHLTGAACGVVAWLWSSRKGRVPRRRGVPMKTPGSILRLPRQRSTL